MGTEAFLQEQLCIRRLWEQRLRGYGAHAALQAFHHVQQHVQLVGTVFVGVSGQNRGCAEALDERCG